MTAESALIIDVCTVVSCAMVARRCASSFLHPSLIMIACHIYIVTLRLWQIFKGYNPMAYTLTWPVQVGEVIRAGLASDVALVAMAAAWVVVRYWGPSRPTVPGRIQTTLSIPRVRAAAFLSIFAAVAAIGIVGPHNLLNATDTSGYLSEAADWAPWGFCLLHYVYGFPLPLVAGTVISLIGTMLVSRFRGVVIIPLVFLIFTWLQRRKTQRLPWTLAPAALVLWLVWLPLKPIFQSIQQGKSLSDSFSYGINVAFANFGEERGSAIDFQFLDMIGSAMTMVDMRGSHFWGGTITPLLVGPVPRALWPGKPYLNQYQLDLDIPSRKMAAMKMTAGMLGEAYANFGAFGIVFMPFVASLLFTLAYKRLGATSTLSPGALLYLMFFSTYMQFYRDGIVSAIWFPFVHCAPVGLTALSHWIWPPRGKNILRQEDPQAVTAFPYLPVQQVSQKLGFPYR